MRVEDRFDWIQNGVFQVLKMIYRMIFDGFQMLAFWTRWSFLLPLPFPFSLPLPLDFPSERRTDVVSVRRRIAIPLSLVPGRPAARCTRGPLCVPSDGRTSPIRRLSILSIVRVQRIIWIVVVVVVVVVG